MCRAKELSMLNRLGMRLAWQGHYRAGLILLALALRQSLKAGSVMQEARIRNNMALVFHLGGKDHLAKRQISKAMSLVAARVGSDNKFYKLMEANLSRLPGQAAPERIAA